MMILHSVKSCCNAKIVPKHGHQWLSTRIFYFDWFSRAETNDLNDKMI